MIEGIEIVIEMEEETEMAETEETEEIETETEIEIDENHFYLLYCLFDRMPLDFSFHESTSIS